MSRAGAPTCVVLVGARGSGKSCVGRQVAAALGWAFLDTDELVERDAGRCIAEIFAEEGEAGFRKREAQALAEALAGAERVVATGGGVVLAPHNRRRIRQAGPCFWLRAPAEELYRRVESDPGTAARRPALTAAGGLEEMRQVLAAREPLYAEVADRVVDTAGKPVSTVAAEVLSLVRAFLGGDASRGRSRDQHHSGLGGEP